MGRRRRRTRSWAIGLCAAGLIGVGVGFVDFIRTVNHAEAPDNPRADGIVVFTGGSARISGAMSLLAEGRAERLLISGVNPDVDRSALAGQIDESMWPMLDCCVDLDNARDTIENAAGTHQWVEEHAFQSVIVVTSAYHMPRSMAELGPALGDVIIVPYPVNNPDLNLAEWWHDAEAFQLLAVEYGKLVAAEVRQLIPGSAARAAAF